MKEKFTILITITYLSIVSLNAEEIFLKNLTIKFSGGLNYQKIADINKLADFWNYYFSGYKKYGSVSGEIKELHYGREMEIEAIYNVSRKIGIGLGTGFLRAEKSSFIKAYHGFGTSDYTTGEFKPSVSLIPIKLSFYLQFPLFSKSSFYLKGGTGYYFARMNFSRKTEHVMGGSPAGGGRRDEAKDKGIGFHGGIGFTYNLWKMVELMVEFEGKELRLNNLKSKHTWEDWSNGSYRKYVIEGTLYYIDLKPYGLLWEDLLPDIYSVYFKGRRGVLDMSGFSIKAGIKMKL